MIDTGIGIPQEKLGVIFEAFQQAEAGTARKYGGTGLGLTISQALCQLMGYRISVSSEPGRGSTFSVHLAPGRQIRTAKIARRRHGSGNRGASSARGSPRRQTGAGD